MNNEKTNVIQLFKNVESNVIEISTKKPQSFDKDETFKKVSGGENIQLENLIRDGFESCLISKGGVFNGNVRLFRLHRDGVLEKVNDEPFKSKIDMLKFAFANFDTEKVDFKPLIE